MSPDIHQWQEAMNENDRLRAENWRLQLMLKEEAHKEIVACEMEKVRAENERLRRLIVALDKCPNDGPCKAPDCLKDGDCLLAAAPSREHLGVDDEGREWVRIFTPSWEK